MVLLYTVAMRENEKFTNLAVVYVFFPREKRR